MQDTFEVQINNISNYNLKSLESAMDKYIYNIADIKSKDLAEELKLPIARESTSVAVAVSFNKTNNTVIAKCIYELKNLNLKKYKIKIDCEGKTINGEISVDRIRSLSLIK